jgi:hypothetical protein
MYSDFIFSKRSYLRVYKYEPEYKHANKHLYQIVGIKKDSKSDEHIIDASNFGTSLEFEQPFHLKCFRECLFTPILIHNDDANADIEGDAKRFGTSL